jgi:hypothetical protein
MDPSCEPAQVRSAQSRPILWFSARAQASSRASPSSSGEARRSHSAGFWNSQESASLSTRPFHEPKRAVDPAAAPAHDLDAWSYGDRQSARPHELPSARCWDPGSLPRRPHSEPAHSWTAGLPDHDRRADLARLRSAGAGGGARLEQVRDRFRGVDERAEDCGC